LDTSGFKQQLTQDKENKVNGDRIVKISTSTPIESMSTSTLSAVESIFQNTDCVTASSSNSSLPSGLTKYSDLTWKTKTIKERSTHYDIDVKYPQFSGGNSVAKLNRCIDSIFKYIIDDDKNRLGLTTKDSPNNNEPDYEHSVSLGAKYQIMGIKNGIVSLEIAVTDFTGGGAGNHDYSYTINWDLKSNRLLAPGDIFCSKDYISILTPLVRKQLMKDLSDEGGLSGWINEGTSPNLDNWQNFLLSKGGLIVVFQPYQVTSGSGGIVKAFIPDSIEPHFLCLP
jgi:hypothetical protein